MRQVPDNVGGSALTAPTLVRARVGDVAYWTDEALYARASVRIAFTERTGGVSGSPYGSLNLAAHVGDDRRAVDSNRDALMKALGIAAWRERLTTAEQVHGEDMAVVAGATAGAGACAQGDRRPISATDALITSESGVPLLLCFADCVPIVLVAPGPAVAVVHAGWRGALVSLPGETAKRLAAHANVTTADVVAYVGPHIGPCCYEVAPELLSQFVNAFGTVARAESGALDLGSVVNESLSRAGVPTCSIEHLGTCTAQTTDRFFSHRAEGGLTGRHGALAFIHPSP